MKVAFIGTGSMGGSMARNLAQAGIDITVFDLNAESLKKPAAAGAKVAMTAADCVKGVDVLVTMLPTPAAIDAVMMGSGGVAAALEPNALWIDMSTSIPENANKVAAATANKGIRLIDAPVSGFATGADSGMLSIFAGGDEKDIEVAKPLFDIMGNPDNLFRCGVRGTGYAVKLVLNMLWYDYFVASVEALMLGVKAGVDLEVLRKSLVGSPVNSVILEKDIIPMLRNGDYDEGFAVALVCKDMGLAIDLGRSVGMPLEVSSTVEQIYRRARARYGDKAGELIAAKLYEDDTQTPLRYTN